jgi:hypothetical protein
MPGGDAQTLTADQSAALPAATESFFSVMSQVSGDGFPKPSGEAKTSDTNASPAETPKPPANPSGKTGDMDASMSSTLMAVMAQPRIAAGQSRKPASTQAANLKNAPASQEGNAKSLAKTSDSDAAPAETPKPPANPPGKAPRVAAGEFRKPASTQAVNFKVAPAGQEGGAKPLTDASKSDASPTETPKPLEDPPVKATDIDSSVASTLLAMAAQPQAAADEADKPASTQAVNFKIPSEHGAAPVVLSSSSDSKPESAGSVPKTIGPRPAETSASTTEPAAYSAEPAGSSQQPVEAQIAITPPVAFVSVGPADGTGGALSSQRMKFGTEKNEIAGSTAQKVPTASLKDAISTKAANDLMVGSDSDHSGHKQDSIDSALVMNWPAKASEGNVDVGKGTGAAQSVDHSATQAERVGQLVNQQVVMIRQSGANNLAVSLKLDPHTELTLQLTNHNGQIEASVRWERGEVAGLENHWKDLQESLARQNVQLLPLENKASPRTPASHSESDTVSASPFDQSSQNPQRQSRDAQGDLPPATTVKTVPVTNKATTRTVSRQGWESWA